MVGRIGDLRKTGTDVETPHVSLTRTHMRTHLYRGSPGVARSPSTGLVFRSCTVSALTDCEKIIFFISIFVVFQEKYLPFKMQYISDARFILYSEVYFS